MVQDKDFATIVPWIQMFRASFRAVLEKIALLKVLTWALMKHSALTLWLLPLSMERFMTPATCRWAPKILKQNGFYRALMEYKLSESIRSCVQPVKKLTLLVLSDLACGISGQT